MQLTDIRSKLIVVAVCVLLATFYTANHIFRLGFYAGRSGGVAIAGWVVVAAAWYLHGPSVAELRSYWADRTGRR